MLTHIPLSFSLEIPALMAAMDHGEPSFEKGSNRRLVLIWKL